MTKFLREYNQRRWEMALASHQRALQQIEIIKANPSINQKLLGFWEKIKLERETEFPSLRKEFP